MDGKGGEGGAEAAAADTAAAGRLIRTSTTDFDGADYRHCTDVTVPDTYTYIVDVDAKEFHEAPSSGLSDRHS